MSNSHRSPRRHLLCVATALVLASLVSQPVAAQNTTGAVSGRADAGSQVTVTNPATGFTRTVGVGADGSYRVPLLPPGQYTLQAVKDGAAVGQPVRVDVTLGNTSTVDLGDRGATNLAAIQVIGSRIVTPVDVTSTESATNLTREEIERLPVQRDATAVAVLAPGVGFGDKDLGGVSFGGSSVSENTFYINGLNVTDFYNRVGFSAAPFSFYREFQVKTGGYSVEFGRTTGGVINAVTRSGSNEFSYGAELVWRPGSLQSEGEDNVGLIRKYDVIDRRSLNLYASGPIVRDKLFFFAMYEARDNDSENTNNAGTRFFDRGTNDAFWGAKFDWRITDDHLIEFLAFSDGEDIEADEYVFDLARGQQGAFINRAFTESGGENWAATYTGYLSDTFSVKALYGETERNSSSNSLNDINCELLQDRRVSSAFIGCTSNTTVFERTDEREQARLDFEWSLGDHLIRFGLDREVNTSENFNFYPGGGLRYEIFPTNPGDTLANGATVPAGVTAYVRTREVANRGTFETENTAYYVEDNWSVTPNLVLNLGLRVEAFDNKNANGESYIKIDDMVAPRLGFSWDVNGDQRSKLFGNVGRYYLPVANVINIKQAGPFLDRRFFYEFGGFTSFTNNGITYPRVILGPQIGGVDDSQGNGQVPDVRGKVDRDMDPVYQDELILGFQALISDTWSWGVRGIYRRLTNAIDDMNITANGACGLVGAPGFVMANPGRDFTFFGDTNCDGVADGWITIDTSREGWALRTNPGGVFRGQRGWLEPDRSYRAVELVLDRAWDERWALNASYTWSYSRGNVEGPVNSDFNFADAGRTEAFDDPWVNLGAGPLPNDRTHQFKLRGSYALGDHWRLGATLNAQSGRPISALGVGNPFDRQVFHSFFTCVAQCGNPDTTQRVYEFNPRGSEGRLPWTYDLGANVAYLRDIGAAKFRVDLSVFNLLNSQRVTEVNENRQTSITQLNPFYLQGTGYQAPRYVQLRMAVDF